MPLAQRTCPINTISTMNSWTLQKEKSANADIVRMRAYTMHMHL